ncbi:MAG TPA: glycosyltransferase family A protein [Chloroflexia bacterium]|nr:glycosyltransferase family A protein [Chloroflexia bacterium]
MDGVALPVTAIISTRNRSHCIAAAVESVLMNDYPCFELIVLDQSDNNLTEKALTPYLNNPRLVYVRSNSRGLGIGHNIAVSIARTELLAFTDDDCLVAVDWISQIVQAFQVDQEIGLVFGNVLPTQYDVKTGYIPVFIQPDAYLLKSLKGDLKRGMGIGACFALKKSIWEKVKGFDQMLGPGAPLGSLEDRDIAIRVLLAGKYVYHTPAVRVVHLGFRQNRELRKLAFRDWFGFGSSFAKYLKCGHWDISYYMIYQMWTQQAFLRIFHSILVQKRISNVTASVSFWIGFIAGLFSSVDDETTLFKPGTNLTYTLTALTNQVFLAWKNVTSHADKEPVPDFINSLEESPQALEA